MEFLEKVFLGRRMYHGREMSSASFSCRIKIYFEKSLPCSNPHTPDQSSCPLLHRLPEQAYYPLSSASAYYRRWGPRLGLGFLKRDFFEEMRKVRFL